MRAPRLLLVAVVAVALLGTACDRQPDSAQSDRAGTHPVVVEQAVSGPFAVERRSSGLVRARRELEVTVREPGEVVAVGLTATVGSVAVKRGQELVRLRSPELELELAEARSELTSAELRHRRQQQLAGLGLSAQTAVEESLAQVERSRILVDRLLLRQSSLTVTAPGDGVMVDGVTVALGQWCAVGLTVARIVDLSSVVVEVTVPSGWGHELDQVSRAVLELDGGGEVAATVAGLSAAVDERRGGRVLTLAPPPGTTLAPGALLPVRLVFAARDQAVSVPVEALVDDDGQWLVLLGPPPGESAALRRTKVVLGPSDGRRTVVEEGLEAGAWVVLVSDLESLSWGWTSYVGVGR